jgi:small-conductance mechanosensitive channel
MNELLAYQFLGNSVLNWGLAALAFLFTFLVIPLVRSQVRARRMRWAEAHQSTALDLIGLLISRTSRLVLLIIALYLAEHILTLPVKLDRAFEIIIIVGVWIQVGLWVTATLRFFIERRPNMDAAAKTSVSILMFGAQIVIWAIFILLALDNLGVNITALVAGLGVGGIAVALATQTLLGDLFASLSIAFDRPFAIGDSVKVDDVEGTVGAIGLRSTRIRAVTGEQITVANADMLKSRVRNMKRMNERRLLFKLYFAYGTEADKLDRVAAIVKQAVEAQKDSRFVQCLLTSLGAYAIEFEVIWFVSTRAGVEGNRIVDAVNRTIVRELQAAGLTPTYPTSRVLTEAPAAAEHPPQAASPA